MQLRSTEIKELMSALIKAKTEFRPIKADKSGARNDYATVAAMHYSTFESLKNNDLILHFEEVFYNDRPFLRTELFHSPTGQFTASFRQLILSSTNKDENQAYGAALTYAKRYSMATILGLYTGEDDIDDKDYEDEYTPITNEQCATLLAELAKNKTSSVVYSNVCKFNKINEITELPLNKYEDVLRYIKNQNQNKVG